MKPVYKRNGIHTSKPDSKHELPHAAAFLPDTVQSRPKSRRHSYGSSALTPISLSHHRKYFWRKSAKGNLFPKRFPFEMNSSSKNRQ